MENVIHQLPHPRWPGLTSPEVVVLHPYCLTSALIKRRSIFVITPSGHGQPVAAQRVSVVDTVTPPIYGVFLECMGLLRHRRTPPLAVQGWFFWTQELLAFLVQPIPVCQAFCCSVTSVTRRQWLSHQPSYTCRVSMNRSIALVILCSSWGLY